MSKANDSHLLQQRLPGITGILEDLGRWLATAVFEAGEEQGVQKCTDGGLPQALEPLFLALDLYKKVYSKHLKCIVLRIQGTRVSLKVRYSADLIPVKVLGAVPTVEGLPLIPGFVTHITGDVLVNVEIGSVLDLLIMAGLGAEGFGFGLLWFNTLIIEFLKLSALNACGVFEFGFNNIALIKNYSGFVVNLFCSFWP